MWRGCGVVMYGMVWYVWYADLVKPRSTRRDVEAMVCDCKTMLCSIVWQCLEKYLMVRVVWPLKLWNDITLRCKCSPGLREIKIVPDNFLSAPTKFGVKFYLRHYGIF